MPHKSKSKSRSPFKKHSASKKKHSASKKKHCKKSLGGAKKTLWMQYLMDFYCELQKNRPKGEKGLFKEAMTAAKGSYTKVQGIADSSSYASKRHEIVSDIIVPAVRKL